MDSPVRLHWLDPRNPHQPFPPAHLAMREPNGLLAIGGDLSLSRLLRAYAQGIFPWYNPDEPILWWCPDPRTVLRPESLKVSRSFRKTLRRADYAVTFDTVFDTVLNACAAPRASGTGTWLGEDMRRAYGQLHAHGYAHSVEVWRDGNLIGGLYGVAMGRVFFGESMFSRADDASKIALYWLCQQLGAWRFELIDCQVSSAHLQSLGATAMPRTEFLHHLAVAMNTPHPPQPWQFTVEHPAEAGHLPTA
ncbi:leucyl/phenylalanyl-tRNA--protein transferase [Sinimarinibacterium sp. CAU 1509]|uniref:leucyl/phenylalanyl-tRNA--protein transferase n=1 Tax=Sinimarinibacterium sp. CAU 1509 TaxID=2562283 RepID=UPI0010AC5AF8|nr:leucyl/phenylalanyl-tRNA--protein transferase [Sinimarinibacterium sp. CAU 1509]TJY61126.1 leucyl/phenylalanyl-tRNA--protein transferase [Sinimarinibacterium sp. CAU 1509]